MAAPKLSNHDQKDLDKFTKYLIYKCIQVIVQSRLGEKVRTQSKPVSSGSDWFHLAIQDIPEVLSEAKKTFTCASLAVGQHICIEISLKTAEGENMILENWSLTKDERCDANARISYTVYNRMSIMLKSLFSVSRVTPAYQLSRKQGADSYVVCYRIYMGEPQLSHLGHGSLKTKVGAVPTPAGTITLSVAYRTKLLISPQHSMNAADLWGFEFKQDHFTPDFSPRRPCQLGSRNCRYKLEDNELSQDSCATRFSSSPHEAHVMGGASPGMTYWPHDTAQTCPSSANTTPSKNSAPNTLNVFGAFAPHNGSEAEITKSDELPFMTLLHHTENMQQIDANANKQVAAPADEEMVTKDSECACGNGDMNGSHESVASKSSASQASGAEDFVMVELKTPFAGTDCNSDLGRFYRECQGAPPLCMFNDNTSYRETLVSVTEQLSLFDAKTKDFDDFVNSLQCSEAEAQ